MKTIKDAAVSAIFNLMISLFNLEEHIPGTVMFNFKVTLGYYEFRVYTIFGEIYQFQLVMLTSS